MEGRRRLIICIFLLSVLAGCFTDVALTRGIRTGKIQIGSSQEQVAKVAGYPSAGCIKSKWEKGVHYEMWDYARYWCGSNLRQAYVLIFKDGSLIEIRTVQSAGDMEF
jgi:hypothetical protein